VVECWGTGPVALPTKSAATGRFLQLSAGHDHTCALRSDGAVECWGSDLRGQAPAIKSAVSGAFTKVSGGGVHSCALRTDGVIECWGATFSNFGQAPPSKAAASGVFVDVEAGELHTCALRSDGAVECWGYNGEGAAPAVKVSAFSESVNVLPVATFSAPASVGVGQGFTLELNNAQVPGYSGSVTFSYAFDCGDATGYGAFGSGNTTPCLTNAIGTRIVKGTVKDQDGDQTEYTGSVSVIYPFGGFVGPVDPAPVLNVAKPGSAIPVRFSLGGNRGLAIFASGYPVSQTIGCSASSTTDPIEQTVTAGGSSLSYNATTDEYTYIWKTDKAWVGTCRILTLRFIDGAEYTALFQFK
jgi:Regulator of Chromosome Condensation (RCC1) repeat protein